MLEGSANKTSPPQVALVSVGFGAGGIEGRHEHECKHGLLSR